MRITPTLMIALGTVLAAAGAQADHAPAVTVRVYDLAGVSGKSLAKAEAEAQHILRRAGIETEWLACPKNREEEDRYPACQKPIGPADVILQIVPRTMEGYEVGPKAFGFALPSGNGGPAMHAYVFFRRVEQAARENNKISLATLLSYVMVHEIGHLLLGPAMHSPLGIMRAHWQPEEFRDMESGRLIFPSQQARVLQARVEERAKSETVVR
jgi:hypothetical protein